ncbi:hexapeptide repeat of succinyl-transferase domain-containing protein [Sarocladium implicatum]|nr:hexapeptide repeat of succinyl-transferase domain-containing protein [Sarocladium implicatum]
MSAFTALNGGSPKASDSAADAALNPEDRPRSSAAQSQAGTEASTQRESWTSHIPESSTMQRSPPADLESSLKRKRSSSIEQRRDPPVQERTPDTAVAPMHESRDPFGTPHRDRDHWYTHQAKEDRSQHEVPQSSRASPGHMEEHIRDALGNAAQTDRSEYDQTSPDGDERSVAYGSPHTASHRQGSILQHDPKKRKRNFSNRTKTGCMTCRGRKKKCDETKPECINCVKGGFVCAGYPAQKGAQWQKPNDKTPAVPLESKDPSYVPPGAYGMPQQGPYSSQPGKREQLPPYRGQTLRIDPPQGRPLTTEDDRPTASTIPSASVASPDNKLSAISTYTAGNVFPTPVSANTQPPSFNERMNKDYQRVPPLHDLARNEPETPHPGGHLPQINILHVSRKSSPSQGGQQPSTSNPQVAAQLALSHSGFPGRRTQKEEMLTGRNYYPFDKELCLERERCASACWRFNNLTIPSHGVSHEERGRLFLDILQPRDPVRVSPTEVSPVTNVGRVGREVAVETPFNCDYGYNITIGSHVVVGRNCHINDVCEVKIGDNCVIGPNVNIYTATLSTDPKRRMGGQGPQSGKPVVVEQDCWIGGGAIILPGKTIGKGATVGAGSVVTKDVPPFTVVAGNPARVLRGVAN